MRSHYFWIAWFISTNNNVLCNLIKCSSFQAKFTFLSMLVNRIMCQMLNRLPTKEWVNAVTSHMQQFNAFFMVQVNFISHASHKWQYDLMRHQLHKRSYFSYQSIWYMMIFWVCVNGWSKMSKLANNKFNTYHSLLTWVNSLHFSLSVLAFTWRITTHHFCIVIRMATKKDQKKQKI